MKARRYYRDARDCYEELGMDKLVDQMEDRISDCTNAYDQEVETDVSDLKERYAQAQQYEDQGDAALYAGEYDRAISLYYQARTSSISGFPTCRPKSTGSSRGWPRRTKRAPMRRMATTPWLTGSIRTRSTPIGKRGLSIWSLGSRRWSRICRSGSRPRAKHWRQAVRENRLLRGRARTTVPRRAHRMEAFHKNQNPYSQAFGAAWAGLLPVCFAETPRSM